MTAAWNSHPVNKMFSRGRNINYHVHKCVILEYSVRRGERGNGWYVYVVGVGLPFMNRNRCNESPSNPSSREEREKERGG